MEDKSQLLMLSLPHANIYRKWIKAKGATVLISAPMEPIYCLRVCVCVYVCVTLLCLSVLTITLSSSQHVLIKKAVYESLLYLLCFGTGVRLQYLQAAQLNTDYGTVHVCLQFLCALLIRIDWFCFLSSMQADQGSNIYIYNFRKCI